MRAERLVAQSRQRWLAQQQLLQDVAATGKASVTAVESDQSKVGWLSRTHAMQLQAMANAGVEQREQLLDRIAAALQRIDDGDSGDCEACGEAIDPRRLDVDLAATLCIGCAMHAER